MCLSDNTLSSGVAPIFVNDNAQNFIVIVPGANMGLSLVDARAASDVIWSGFAGVPTGDPD